MNRLVDEGQLKKQILDLIDESGVDSDVIKVWDGKRYDNISLNKAIIEKFDEAKKDIIPQNKIKELTQNWPDVSGIRIIIVPEAKCYESGTIEVETDEHIDITDKIKRWFGDST